MKIYIDTEYKCHCDFDVGYLEVETNRFDDKCKYYIESYRFIPKGYTWITEDGSCFIGEMVVPWRVYDGIVIVQTQYEEDEAIHLTELAGLIDEIYAEDLEVIES